MMAFSEWRPTSVDPAGNGPDGIQGWIVAPVIRKRDSGILEKSNFETALGALGGESATVEIHRFGHWGPGWIEIILVDPCNAAAMKAAEDMEASLAEHPCLDDEDYDRRVREDLEEALVKAGCPAGQVDAVCEWMRRNAPEMLEHGGYGYFFDRSDLVAALLAVAPESVADEDLAGYIDTGEAFSVLKAIEGAEEDLAEYCAHVPQHAAKAAAASRTATAKLRASLVGMALEKTFGAAQHT